MQYPYIQALGEEVTLIPPFPGLRVTVAPPHWIGSDRQLEVDSFLDTGSDCTLLSYRLMLDLKLEIFRSDRVVLGLAGGEMPGISAYLNLIIGDRDFSGIKAYGASPEFVDGIVIGRDILNLMCIEFDGPNQVFTIKDH